MSCNVLNNSILRRERNSPKVARTDSYRLAVRKSGANIDKQQSQAKNVSIKPDDDNADEKQNLIKNQPIITHQPFKSINNTRIDYVDKIDNENNGSTKKSVDNNEEITVLRENDDVIREKNTHTSSKTSSQFCCEKCCCNYWVCCPDCFFQKLKAMETYFANVSNSCLNKIRVFT